MAVVTCLGIIVADAIAKPVEAIPDKGKLNLVDQLELHIGGCASNAGIALAKMGIDTNVIGKIGKDGFGDFVFHVLKKAGLGVEGIRRTEDCGTSATVVLVSKDGERTFLHYTGANGEFVEDDVDYSIIEKSEILFIAGSLLMPKFDGEPTARVLKRAKEMGIYTVLDTAWDSTGRWMSAIGPCLPYLDLFIPSLEEAKMLSGKEDPEAMADLFMEMGAKNIVIKLGSQGCFIKNSREKHLVPAFKVKAVDATGAGDSFVAGFITGLVKGWDLKRCGIFANALGAQCVMTMGASDWEKSFDEVVEFIKGQGIEF